MMPQDRDSLFGPPLPRLQKTSVIFESPLKYIRKRKEQDLFSPDRRSGTKPTNSLIAPILRKVRLDVQLESVAKNPLNHVRRKMSTLYSLEMAADSLMEVEITTAEEITTTLQQGVMESKIA